MNVLERIKTFDWSQRLSLSLKHYCVDREGYHSESYVSDKEAEQELIKLAEIGQRMQWVKSSEQLPDKSGSYLCWYIDGFGNSGYWVGYWDDERKGFYTKWECNPSRHEKYWMPLPNKPI